MVNSLVSVLTNPSADNLNVQVRFVMIMDKIYVCTYSNMRIYPLYLWKKDLSTVDKK